MTKRQLLHAALMGSALHCTSYASAETIAIVDARLMTMTQSGLIEKGTILIQDGVIVALGKSVSIPSNARVIDGKGGVVTPGFIQADSTLGAVEISQDRASADRSSHGENVGAAFDISLGLNPQSTLLPIARLAGITHAIATPLFDDNRDRPQQFAGLAAVVDMGQRGRMVTRPRVAMVLELGEGGAQRVGGARGAAMITLKTTLADVRHFAAHRSSYDLGKGRPQRLSRADLEALVPVVQGRIPLIVKVERASDICEILDLAKEERLKIILDGASEGWRVANKISAASVPVILDPTANLPRSFSQLGARLDNAARLHAAGVTVIVKTGSGVAHRARELRYAAGNAVASGMPYSAAVAAITINPARVFGVSDRVGDLKTGRLADLVLWNGDPLEPLTQPSMVLVEGREMPLDARSLRLRDRYLISQP